MTARSDAIRLLLARGPATARALCAALDVSQPTLSRELAALGQEVLRIGAARSIQYVLRSDRQGLGHMPVYRVGTDGRIRRLGELIAVRPEGFVMLQEDGIAHHSEGLPWWLLDMRPQGFLGRAYASRHATALGLPAKLEEWSDSDALRALLASGQDAVGNLLLGDVARQKFIDAPPAVPLQPADIPSAYIALAAEVASGDNPGSSAGGEQPKFTSYGGGGAEARHVLVKFSLGQDNPITQRWRDLLLAEHHALDTLRRHGIEAAVTRIVDASNHRFLEVERFDRVGASGRRALFSLTAVEAEFVGNATAPWHEVVEALAKAGVVTPESAATAARLHAYGTLIGNTDMHHGNLSFTSEHGRPYRLAPAYDMLPMGFAPRTSGQLADSLQPANLRASIPPAAWKQAFSAASAYLARLQAEPRFSQAFAPCIAALARHLDDAGNRLQKLA